MPANPSITLTLFLLVNLASASLQTHCPHDALNPLSPIPNSSPIQINFETRPPFPPHTPWTNRPFCDTLIEKEGKEQEFCVYSSSSYNLNSGLSILTTPETAAGLATAVSSNFKPHWDARVHLAEKGVLDSNESTRPYKYIKMPGRGLGVVATRKIKQFETIMTNFPTVIIDNAFFSESEEENGNEDAADLFEKMLQQLGDIERVLSLARSRGEGVHVIEDAVRTNAFGMTLNGRKSKGLFPEIARMNHACDPNAFPRFSARSLAMTAIATREILPGEEITISYIPVGMSTPSRQTHLANWHFNCTCALCSAPAQAREASDSRREQILELLYGMQEPSTSYETLIEMTREFIELAQVERLITKVGEYYQVLMKLFYEKGDPESARKYGRAALMFGEIFSDAEGEFCAGLREDLEVVERVISESGGS
ncbi:hypothetical protein QBC43DRAFT_359285 [Cladorrhinum sp. PSN259]|nr:hypothetical protein QBC43DRAFT_359285 [Cladorrhinum sp. PSN259]